MKRSTNELGIRNRLYRDRQRGVILGVCAGFAEYFGFDLNVTRVLVVVAAFSFPLTIIAYLLFGLLLPTRPNDGPARHSDDPIEREVRQDPHATLSSVRYRFRDLDSRLQRLEKYVTSNRFRLDREFRELRE
jgi:phage shock protein C